MTLLAIVLAGCGTPHETPDADAGDTCALEPGLSDGTIGIGGQDRRYLLSVPEGADAPLPLVVGFHGAAFTPETFRASLFVEREWSGAALFVYPEALAGAPRTWDLAHDGADLALFDAIEERLTSSGCADPARVFVFGRSVGGYMTNEVGCTRASLVRAIAPTIAGGPTGPCEGTVSAWIASVEDDPTVDISEGEATRDHWTASNGCDATSVPVAPSPCVEMQNCDAGRRVVWCATPTGGHEPPPFAASAIAAFFESF